MRLRELEMRDAPFMLEWMHESECVEKLPTPFMDMTMEQCRQFIEKARCNKDKEIHMAICDEEDEYQGTVSLKNIDLVNGNAEYAISIRRHAMGQGISSFGTKEILRIAFEDVGLSKVYLCVFEDNVRAVKFYNKCSFVLEGNFREHMADANGKKHNLLWYSILREEYYDSLKG